MPTVKELKAELDALGVSYDRTHRKADLEGFLEAATAVAPELEDEPVAEPEPEPEPDPTVPGWDERVKTWNGMYRIHPHAAFDKEWISGDDVKCARCGANLGIRPHWGDYAPACEGECFTEVRALST